jgi:ATP-binding protein involved in chromosome partitioning
MLDKAIEEIEQDERLKRNLAKIKNKLIVVSGKGGVGKTTFAVNLAYSLALDGKKTGILDVDIHGPNVAKMLGIESSKLVSTDLGIEPVRVRDNLKAVSIAFMLKDRDKPIVWRGPMKMITIKQFLSDVNWGELDCLIVDSPPGTGDEPLSVCQLIPDINAAIIVTTPQEVAILDSRKCVNFAKQLKIPFVGIVENMSGFVCPHCGEDIDLFGKGGGEKAAFDLSVEFLGSIPVELGMVKSGDSGQPFIYSRKDTRTAGIMAGIIYRISGSEGIFM